MKIAQILAIHWTCSVCLLGCFLLLLARAKQFRCELSCLKVLHGSRNHTAVDTDSVASSALVYAAAAVVVFVVRFAMTLALKL